MDDRSPPAAHSHDLSGNEPPHDQLTLGARAADWIAKTVGSWPFIIGQSCILVVWAILNVVNLVKHWDPYPFILMNLFLSLQAAFTAPMIMMSQNRQAARDRWLLRRDVQLDTESNKISHELLQRMNSIEDHIRGASKAKGKKKSR